MIIYSPENYEDRNAFEHYLRANGYEGNYLGAERFYVEREHKEAQREAIEDPEYVEKTEDLEEAIEYVRHGHSRKEQLWEIVRETGALFIENEKEGRIEKGDEVIPDEFVTILEVVSDLKFDVPIEDEDLKKVRDVHLEQLELHPDRSSDGTTPYDRLISDEVIETGTYTEIPEAVNQTSDLIAENSKRGRTDFSGTTHPDFVEVMTILAKYRQNGDNLVEDASALFRKGRKVYIKHAEMHPDYPNNVSTTPFDKFLETADEE